LVSEKQGICPPLSHSDLEEIQSYKPVRALRLLTCIPMGEEKVMARHEQTSPTTED
jgi:hypothetical protein